MEQMLQLNIRTARKRMLDLLEGCMGHDPKWRFIRARSLEIFGELERTTLGEEEKDSKGTVYGNQNKGG